MRTIGPAFWALIEEWEQASLWSDLTQFACVESELLRPCQEALTRLEGQAKQNLQMEENRLQELRLLDQDAQYFSKLINSQVPLTSYRVPRICFLDLAVFS